MAKSLNLCFALWAIGGPLGLHHLYLGRDRQFLLWFSSFGAFFVGWIADVCRIPGYVAQANCSPAYLGEWELRRGRKVTGVQLSRWVGALAFSLYFEFATVYALDAHVRYLTSMGVVCIKASMRALAVFACFSVGEKTSSSWWIFFGSLTSELMLRGLFRLFLPAIRIGLCPGDTDGHWHFIVTSLPIAVCIGIAFVHHRYREKLTRNRHLFFRLPVLLAFISLWVCFLLSALYHHLEVPTTPDASESRKLKYVMADFWGSDTYRKLRATRASFDLIRKEIGIRSAGEHLAEQLGLLQPAPPSAARNCLINKARLEGLLESIAPSGDATRFDDEFLGVVATDSLGKVASEHLNLMSTLEDVGGVCWNGSRLLWDYDLVHDDINNINNESETSGAYFNFWRSASYSAGLDEDEQASVEILSKSPRLGSLFRLVFGTDDSLAVAAFLLERHCKTSADRDAQMDAACRQRLRKAVTLSPKRDTYSRTIAAGPFPRLALRYEEALCRCRWIHHDARHRHRRPIADLSPDDDSGIEGTACPSDGQSCSVQDIAADPVELLRRSLMSQADTCSDSQEHGKKPLSRKAAAQQGRWPEPLIARQLPNSASKEENCVDIKGAEPGNVEAINGLKVLFTRFIESLFRRWNYSRSVSREPRKAGGDALDVVSIQSQQWSGGRVRLDASKPSSGSDSGGSAGWWFFTLPRFYFTRVKTSSSEEALRVAVVHSSPPVSQNHPVSPSCTATSTSMPFPTSSQSASCLEPASTLLAEVHSCCHKPDTSLMFFRDCSFVQQLDDEPTYGPQLSVANVAALCLHEADIVFKRTVLRRLANN